MKNLRLVLCLSILTLFGARLSHSQEPWPSYVLGAGGGGYEFLSGKEETASLGRKLTSLGDIDGDGVSEWGISTSSGGDKGHGVYIVSGKSWPFYQQGGLLLGGGQADASLISHGILYRLLSAETGQQSGFGFSMTGLGDINQDGYDDIAIGAPFASVGGKNNVGKQIVIFGGKDFFATTKNITFDNDLMSKDVSTFVINGGKADDHFGISISAGDIDGDGAEDVAVGAYRWGDDEKGATYVLWGGENFSRFEGTTIGIDDLLGAGQASILSGLNGGERLGWSLHIGGDMNRDGSEELVIGAPGFDSGRGRVYVVSGRDRFQGGLDMNVLRSTGSVLIFDGLVANGESGWTVGGGEDVNGDGFSDILIGTRNIVGMENWPSGGSVAVLFGGSALKGRYRMADIGKDVAGYVLSGRLLGTDGFEAAMLKDLNGDGFGDYAIGIAGSGSLEGRVIVVYGGLGLGRGQHELSKVLAGKEVLRGMLIVPPLSVNGGEVVVGNAGDVNQDGHNDMLVSLPLANVENLRNGGKTYVLFGSPLVTSASGGLILGSDESETLSAENADRTTNIYGYGGDDAFEVTNDLFGKVDGGRGKDTLVFSGSSLYLGSQAVGKVSSVEALDLRKGLTKLHLDSGAALGEELEILSDGDDKIVLEGFEAAQSADGWLGFRSKSSRFNVKIKGVIGKDVVLLDKGGVVTLNRLDEMGMHEGLLLRGAHNNMRLGHSFAGVGDMNGDGIEDFAVGAVYAGSGAGKRRAGRTYILYGGSLQAFRGQVDVGDSLESHVGSLIDGDGEKSRSGWAVGGGFDVNADGYDDLVMGAPHGGSDEQGRVYVVFGRRGGIGKVDLSSLGDDKQRALEIVGEEVGAYAGWSVSSVGDMNGDGIAEVVMGVPHGDGKDGSQNSGRVLILYGDKNLHELGSVSAADIGGKIPGARFDGAVEGGRLGWSVSGVGDVDGDGLSDVAMGAPGGGDFIRIQEGNTVQGGGRVYVLGGKRGGSLSLRNAYVLSNQVDGENLGFSVSGGSDVNGDGLSDVLVGSPRGGYGGGGEGFVILLRGSKDLLSRGRVEDVREAGTIELVGDLPGSRFGYSVSSVGDMNGDGLSEILVGAPRYISGAYGLSGAGYIIDGRSTWKKRYASLKELDVKRFDGMGKDEQLGMSVSSLGDVNNDGRDDFVFGSYYADSQQFNNSGIGYILYGLSSN